MKKQPHWKRKPIRPKWQPQNLRNQTVIAFDWGSGKDKRYSALMADYFEQNVIASSGIKMGRIVKAEISADGMSWVDITGNVTNVTWGAP